MTKTVDDRRRALTMTTNTGDTLEPCPNPWCDATTAAVPVGGECGWRVLCACGIRTTKQQTPDLARAAWNRRPSPPAGEGEPVAWVETRALDILAAGEPFAMTTVSREGAGSRTPLYALPQPTTAGERAWTPIKDAPQREGLLRITEPDGFRYYVVGRFYDGDNAGGPFWKWSDGGYTYRENDTRIIEWSDLEAAPPPREPETSDRDALALLNCIEFTEAGIVINMGDDGIYGWTTPVGSTIAPVVVERFKARRIALSAHTSGAGSAVDDVDVGMVIAAPKPALASFEIVEGKDIMAGQNLTIDALGRLKIAESGDSVVARAHEDLIGPYAVFDVADPARGMRNPTDDEVRIITAGLDDSEDEEVTS